MGADLLVDNGTLIAQALGVPESVIALTFVALGTDVYKRQEHHHSAHPAGKLQDLRRGAVPLSLIHILHGLVAAAAAGKAVQVHHKGYLALGIGQGHDAAQGVACLLYTSRCV